MSPITDTNSPRAMASRQFIVYVCGCQPRKLLSSFKVQKIMLQQVESHRCKSGFTQHDICRQDLHNMYLPLSFWMDLNLYETNHCVLIYVLYFVASTKSGHSRCTSFTGEAEPNKGVLKFTSQEQRLISISRRNSSKRRKSTFHDDASKMVQLIHSTVTYDSENNIYIH